MKYNGLNNDILYNTTANCNGNIYTNSHNEYCITDMSMKINNEVHIVANKTFEGFM